MTLQQGLQLAITILFVAVLLELFVALTLFHLRMWREERARRRAGVSRPHETLKEQGEHRP